MRTRALAQIEPVTSACVLQGVELSLRRDDRKVDDQPDDETPLIQLTDDADIGAKNQQHEGNKGIEIRASDITGSDLKWRKEE